MRSLDILKPKNTRSILQADKGGLGDQWIQNGGRNGVLIWLTVLLGLCINLKYFTTSVLNELIIHLFVLLSE